MSKFPKLLWSNGRGSFGFPDGGFVFSFEGRSKFNGAVRTVLVLVEVNPEDHTAKAVSVYSPAGFDVGNREQK